MRSGCCLENPISPESGSQLGFAGDVGGDAGGLVVPVDALEGLEAVAAEDAEVAFERLAVGGSSGQAEIGERDGDFVDGFGGFTLGAFFGGGGELHSGADVFHFVDGDGPPGEEKGTGSLVPGTTA